MERETNGLVRAALLTAGALGIAWWAREIFARSQQADLSGQVVLITGGSRGLGLLLADTFAQQGCQIAICARDAQELEAARSLLAERGAQVFALPCDIGDRQAAEQMVAEVTRHYGQIDILVNNAMTLQVGPVLNMTIEDFEQVHRVGFWGMLYCTWAVLPQMRARRSGRIVNITSFGGRVSAPHLVPYCSAKFAATGLSEGLRAELAGEGISVTTILPGELRTGAQLNTIYRGYEREEFNWFSTGLSWPLGSMDAREAARQIVEATRRGEPERTLTLTAQLWTLLHGIAPGAMTEFNGFLHRHILPPVRPDYTPAGDTRGRAVQQREARPVMDTLLQPGEVDAERYNQRAGQ